MKTTKQGFTIVELLIVVVVIAILAAITIVAYNGITNDAETSALKSDLSTAAKKLQVAKINGDGTFPVSPDFIPAGLTYSSGGNAFCVFGTANGKDFRITEVGSIQEGSCALPVATTMQQFTSAHCAAADIYTGSNPAAIKTLTDSRGGVTQTYEVAKLADNNCWMITNLRLGSTTGAITLTPADSNVASNFTLPQVKSAGLIWDITTNPGNNYDTPYAYGPVPGDTGSGSANYGYLYNWSAATAGETRTTKPAGSGDTPYSICPVNWRLPTSGTGGVGEFAMLNAKMNNPSATAGSISGGTGFYQNWQYAGPFKGVLSGLWYGGSFNSQSSNGLLWSRSAHASGANFAHYAYFNVSNVDPAYGYFRYYGLGVRCLLN